MRLNLFLELLIVAILIVPGIFLVRISLRESTSFWLSDTRSRIKLFILAIVLIVFGVAFLFENIL